MSYSRQETQDNVTVMNKFLYDNLQDGIEEALNGVSKLLNVLFGSGTLEAPITTSSGEEILTTNGEVIMAKKKLNIDKQVKLSFNGAKGVIAENAHLGKVGESGGSGSYELPIATSSRLGGVMVGNGIKVAVNGTISTDVEATAEHAAELAENEIARTENDFTESDVEEIFS